MQTNNPLEKILGKMQVLLNNVQWKPVHISMYKKPNGQQWIHLKIQNGDKTHVYQIDQQYVKNSWLQLVFGHATIDQSTAIVDGAKWLPLTTGQTLIGNAVHVFLELWSGSGEKHCLAIDRDSMKEAYCALDMA